MAKKQLNLTPEDFKVNENGEIVINSTNLTEALKSSDESTVGEQGVRVAVSF